MADFQTCFSFVLPNEDYTPPRYEPVADPVLPMHPDAQALAGINSAFWPEDFARIVALPKADRGPAVANFYRFNFWNRWFDQMASNRLAAMTLDSAVNNGAGWAVRFLQTAVGSAADGLWGTNTLAKANSVDVDEAVQKFIAAREARYRSVGGPSLPQWLARASKVPEFA